MSYLIYLRKSRKDADLESLGIDVLARHEKTLLEYARTHSLSIGGIYREVVSGDSIDARPEMRRLLSEVESGVWEGVLVMEVERLARGDTIDQGRVQRAFFFSGTLIVTPSKIYDPTNEFDNEYFEFSLFMSRREYATIKRRMQRGRLRSVQDGYFVGNVPPYGWMRVLAKDGKHFTLAPDPKEEPVLQLMYDFIGNKGYGYQKTCVELSKMGIVSRSGKVFNPSTIKGIISNPVNIGKVRWNYRRAELSVVDGVVKRSRPKAANYELVDGEHKGCIDPDLFHRANTIGASHSAPVRLDRPIQNPFAGILYCSCCGRVMVRKKANSKTPYDFLICQYTGCKTVGVRSDELEQALLQWLQDYIAKYDFKKTDEDSINFSAQESVLQNLEKQHSTLLKQRASLFDLLEQGVYTKDVFLERSNSLEKRLKDCLDEIHAVQKELSRMEAIRDNRDSFIPRCKNILDTWDNLDAAGKNAALRSLLERVVLTKTVKNTRNHTDSDFSIDVYPKVPK